MTPTTSGFARPTGHQHEIACGPHRAMIVEVGGGLRTYTVDGRDVVDGYRVDEPCTGGRGQVLLPWPNRLRDGRYRFRGTEYQLPVNEPDKGNAIHGLVRWTRFTAVRGEEVRVTMLAHLTPQPGYPFAIEVRVDYEASPAGLRVTTTSTNIGDSPVPYGVGAHPYLRLGMSTIDGLEVKAPGRVWLRTDDRAIPIGSAPVDGTPFDLCHGRRLGDTVLDTAYTDMERDEAGRAWVQLTDGQHWVRLWMDDAFAYLMLFTGDTLEVGRRRRGLAVEPMTCAPNAFQSGDGLIVLAPGNAHTATWGITASV